LKSVRRKAGERKSKHRSKLKVTTLLTELQAADFVVFPTEILNCHPELIEEWDDEAEDGLEIVSHGSNGDLKARCVLVEVRWRWTLKVLWVAA
jgi:hypothetical protein